MDKVDEKDYSRSMTLQPDNTGEKDYERLIAAQNEAKRRLKIKGINNALSDEKKKMTSSAIASGVCFAGLLAAFHFSGIDMHQAIEAEIKALSSFDGLKEYLGMFTPAMWGAMIATAISFTNYIKHEKKHKIASRELSDMMEIKPENYQDVVESQARRK